MKEFFLFLSENIIFAWVILVLIILIIVFIILLFYAAFKENRPIRFWMLEISKRSEKVDVEADDRGHDSLESVDIQPINPEWEPHLQESVDRFPESLKRILASNLAERLGKQYNPEILLAVQESGPWLAEHLVNWLDGKPQIIMVEKDMSQDRAEDFLEIPMKTVRDRPNLFIANKELLQNTGDMVIVDDFIYSGSTVRSIIDRLKEKNKNVKGVATIAIDKATLDGLQDYLKKNDVELAYLLTAPGALTE